eukprot:9251861-Lingulodinium_polyedra.AAC.1
MDASSSRIRPSSCQRPQCFWCGGQVARARSSPYLRSNSARRWLNRGQTRAMCSAISSHSLQ